MDLTFSPEDERFRDELRTWLRENLRDFPDLHGRGYPGDMDALVERRRLWERRLAAGRWTCLPWPERWGGRAATLHQEMIFHEEYIRAGAPGRLGHIGETLLGPTLLEWGSEEQKRRFLPPIAAAEQLWCQGYSEPNAGSDLAGLATRAELVGGRWVVHGQKVWTSLATLSDWCFALCRTDPHAERRHDGITCLLLPMRQPGVKVRPIKQITGSSEFCEVFFDGAETDEGNVAGPVGQGWKVAMSTLAHERGGSTLGQQLQFARELERVIQEARRTGAAADPFVRDRIAGLWMRLQVMRHHALRLLTSHARGGLPREATIAKLYWATLHQELGELAVDVLGDEALVLGPHDLHGLFLWTRADTIYAGTNEIQRNLIATRALGLPRS